LSGFTFCGFPRFAGADRLGGGGPQEGDDAPDDGEREWRRHPARTLQAVDRRRAGNDGCAKPYYNLFTVFSYFLIQNVLTLFYIIILWFIYINTNILLQNITFYVLFDYIYAVEYYF